MITFISLFEIISVAVTCGKCEGRLEPWIFFSIATSVADYGEVNPNRSKTLLVMVTVLLTV